MAVRPNTSSRASADSAPTKTPLQDTYHGRKPSSGSTATTSSTSILAIAFSFGCPRLALPVLRAAEVGIQPLFVLAHQRHARIELGSSFDVSLRQVDVYLPVFPAHAPDPLGRDQDLTAGKPVSCVDDDVADRPRLVVDQEIFDVAEVAVGRVDVVAHHVTRAPQMRVGVLALADDLLLDLTVDGVRLRRGGGQHGIRELSPPIRAVPVVGIPVILREGDFPLPVDRPVGLHRRTVAHLLLRQRRAQPRGSGNRLKRERRDQYLSARQPRPGVDDEITDRPGLIVEVQILNATDVAVHRLDRDALEMTGRPEHAVLLPEIPLPRGRPAPSTSRAPAHTPARACAARPANRTFDRSACT